MKFAEFVKEYEVMQREMEEEAKSANQKRQQLEQMRFRNGKR